MREGLLSVLETTIERIDRNWHEFRMHSGGYWVNSGWDGPVTHFELNYCVKGEGTVSLNGDAFDVKPNDLWFNSDSIRFSNCMQDKLELYYVTFYIYDPGLDAALHEAFSYLISCNPLPLPGLADDFASFLSEMRMNRFASTFTKHLFLHIWMKIYRAVYLSTDLQDMTTSVRHERMVLEIMRDILEHQGDKISLAFLAERYALNERYLNQLFKSVSGMTIGQYINKIRIDRSKRLLETTNLRITEVAVEAGFYDAAHFCKTFKSLEAASPAAYRKRQSGGLPAE